jgi:predicted SnoaL-like aldol condensation-catalyzing enzyme
MKSNKTIVLECYRKIIRDLDLSVIDQYIHDDYIQHSPSVKNGKAGIVEMLMFLKTLPKPTVQQVSPIIRVIAEGDYVAVHLNVAFLGKQIAVIDMYRLHNGKLAEHWDVGEEQLLTNQSPITTTNGSTVIEDSADAEANKNLIAVFYEEVLKPRNLNDVDNWLTQGFIDHNLKEGLLKSTKQIIKIHKMIAEGNFVLTHCESIEGENAFANFDIFKLEDDKIAEHWSVSQQLPTTMAHSNGMF